MKPSEYEPIRRRLPRNLDELQEIAEDAIELAERAKATLDSVTSESRWEPVEIEAAGELVELAERLSPFGIPKFEKHHDARRADQKELPPFGAARVSGPISKVILGTINVRDVHEAAEELAKKVAKQMVKIRAQSDSQEPPVDLGPLPPLVQPKKAAPPCSRHTRESYAAYRNLIAAEDQVSAASIFERAARLAQRQATTSEDRTTPQQVQEADKPLPRRLARVAADLARIEAHAPDSAENLSDAWVWLREHGPAGDWALPSRETWLRYARDVRQRT